MSRRAPIALLALVLTVLTASGLTVGARGVSRPAGRLAAAALAAASPSLCGSEAGNPRPAHYRHVIWIWMENHSYGDLIGAPGSVAATRAPYINGVLKRQCGLATNYHNVTHPSLPNYLAAVAGTTGGVSRDCAPATCPQSARTIFKQVTYIGRQWRAYDENMPVTCDHLDSWPYAARHNPAVYYPAIRTGCQAWDLTFGAGTSGHFRDHLKSGRIAAFTFVTPNLCHDMHDCSITTGDTWLKNWIPRIVASPAYQQGTTAVFVTWDEGENGSSDACALNTTDRGCHVPTFVLSRWTKPGTRSSVLFNHYSLLKTTEDLLDLRRHLGHAADATTRSMRTAFHL